MAKYLLEFSYELTEVEQVLPSFWQCVKDFRVLAFDGAMGAGKTTFIHALCNFLGVKDTVSSPTFSLINEYHFIEDGKQRIIYHMDWYRLQSVEEAINAGIEDTFSREDAYSFVEWPQNAPELLPGTFLWIEISIVSPSVRRLKVLLND